VISNDNIPDKLLSWSLTLSMVLQDVNPFTFERV